MPELPEVENVVRGLRENIVGRSIDNLKIINDPILGKDKSRIKGIVGKSIEDILRRGKYIVIKLNDGAILVHLRMTGKLLYNEDEDKHTHLVFFFDDGNTLIYKDVRKFGRVLYLSDNELNEYIKAKVGIEPLEASLDDFIRVLSKKKGPIKKNLLDQGLIAGIGNIYADEILFASGIRPQFPTENLNDEDYWLIYENTKSILAEAIEAGGSTIRDYVDSSGKAGGFQNFHKVYGRSGLECVTCSTILEKTKVAGRTSVYCPKCQKD